LEDERILSYENNNEDYDEPGLRPKKLTEFIGQHKIKDNLTVFIEAAKLRGEPLDHVLLQPGDLAAILTNLGKNDVLFIDEIHRLNRSVEEILYPAMEDFALDIIIGKGPSARSIRLDLPEFTLIGATTRAGLLTSPLRDRFGVINRLETYSPGELKSIVKRSAGILNIKINEDGADKISRRSRGTPRIANRLLKRVRDFAQIKAEGFIDGDVALMALEALGVDNKGLDDMDKKMIESIIEKYEGGPVGLETLAACIGEESETIEDVYEPYLIQLGFINKTPRGRVVTKLAYEHLGYNIKWGGFSTEVDS